MKRHDDTTIRNYPAGHRLDVGGGSASIIPPIDFETYSTAGLEFENGRWVSALGKGKQKRGIGLVGAFAYAEHASTEILSLAYDLHDGDGERLWLPGLPPPSDLFDYIAGGGHVEAHNALFEFAIWVNVAVKKLGWPWLPLDQLHDSAAKCSAHNIPRALAKAAAVMGTMPKQADGDRMIKLFSMPRNPTKSDQRLRLDPQTHPEGPRLYTYNRDDIRSERELSANLPDLSPFEYRVFKADQAVNVRGVQIDLEAVHGARRIIAAASDRYTRDLMRLTGGQVDAATKVAQMSGWLAGRGYPVPNLDAEVVTGLLKRPDLPDDVRKVLHIRAEMGSTSVSKIETIHHTVSHDGRLRGLYVYGGASQTLRWSGSGAQPQNLPGDGPPVVKCSGCGAYSAPVYAGACYRCEGVTDPSGAKWTPEAADHFIDVIKTGHLTELMQYTGEPLQTISGCLRGLFTAAPGCELIGADYSAIEAVVLACLAGEHWRIEVFKTHGKIYEMSAAQITGVSFDEMMAHKERTGDHHPARKTIGKVSELSSGYQGGLGAWKNFGADRFMSDDEIKAAVKAWRQANPAIVALWYGLENSAIEAVKHPGYWFTYGRISYLCADGVLFCHLPSGRLLKYHSPRLMPDFTPWGAKVEKLVYYGVDGITKQWVEKSTYGGHLTENVCQAVARDIQANGLLNAEAAGLPVVLHTHDELTAETPRGRFNGADLAACMNALPDWCADWPIKAPAGWVGQRYRKD